MRRLHDKSHFGMLVSRSPLTFSLFCFFCAGHISLNNMRTGSSSDNAIQRSILALALVYFHLTSWDWQFGPLSLGTRSGELCVEHGIAHGNIIGLLAWQVSPFCQYSLWCIFLYVLLPILSAVRIACTHHY